VPEFAQIKRTVQVLKGLLRCPSVPPDIANDAARLLADLQSQVEQAEASGALMGTPGAYSNL
jgi:hypothetical protein